MLRRAVILAIALLPLAGCTARHTAGPVQTGFMFQLKRTSFWLHAPHTRDPLTASLEVTRDGQAVYGNACSQCHGADGHGTPMGLAMYPAATDLTSRYAQGYSDRELYYLIWNGIGHSGMPGWHDQLRPEQVWQVIHYMRTLPNASKPSPETPAEVQSRNAQLARGRQLFSQQHCALCHRLGDGPPSDAPDLTFEGDRGRSDAWLIGHFIDPPAYSPGSDMPSFGKLSGEDLNTLAVFLNSLRMRHH